MTFNAQYTTEENFVKFYEIIQTRAHNGAKANGFWENPSDADKLVKAALIMTELAEYVEAVRKPQPHSEHIPAFTPEEEELADIVIRVMDLAGGTQQRVAEAMIAKLEYNRSRGHRHGGKKY